MILNASLFHSTCDQALRPKADERSHLLNADSKVLMEHFSRQFANTFPLFLLISVFDYYNVAHVKEYLKFKSSMITHCASPGMDFFKY